MDFFAEHIKDLSERSVSREIFTFSQFLNLDEQSVLQSLKRELTDFTLFGGTDGCERVMARFGSEETLGYEQPFPIVCIEISPLNVKFADVLSHRDILGGLMSLGMDRSQTGDIVLRDSLAFAFVVENKAEYICSELKKVKHTDVKCRITTFDSAEPLYKTENCTVIVSSERLDCIIGAVYGLSRNAASVLFDGGKVFVNGKQLLSPSAHAKPGDIISVRGKGRFALIGEKSRTKKNRLVLDIAKYI